MEDSELRSLFRKLNTNLDKVEERFDQIKSRLDVIDGRLDRMDRRIGMLEAGAKLHREQTQRLVNRMGTLRFGILPEESAAAAKAAAVKAAASKPTPPKPNGRPATPARAAASQ